MIEWRKEGDKNQWYGHCGPWDFWLYFLNDKYLVTYHFGHETGDIDVAMAANFKEVKLICRSYAISRTIRLLSVLENEGLR